VGDEKLADIAMRHQDAQNAFGKARLAEEFADKRAVEGGFRCEFQDHRAAGQQGWEEFRQRYLMRRVPRNDGGDHADRLTGPERSPLGIAVPPHLPRIFLGCLEIGLPLVADQVCGALPTKLPSWGKRTSMTSLPSGST